MTEINKLEQLKELNELAVKKYVFEAAGKMKNAKNKSQWRIEKEKRKQKALKRIQKLRQIEEEKEQEKNKWKDFNRKALAKSFKVRKLVFSHGVDKVLYRRQFSCKINTIFLTSCISTQVDLTKNCR